MKRIVYVDMIVRHETDGRLIPLSVIREDHEYKIDKVLNIYPMTTRKSGRTGLR